MDPKSMDPKSMNRKPMDRKSSKSTILKSVFLFLSLGNIVYIALGWPFFHFFTYGGNKAKRKPVKKRKKTNRERWFALRHTIVNHPTYKFEKEYEEGKAWCLAQPVQDWNIRSLDGIKLHASYLPAEDPKRFLILCHGYRGTWYGSMGHMAEFLHKNHCSLLMIDQRCCGKSEGKYITFGAKEKGDIVLWLERLQEINKDRLPIYLYGQSMGATSVLLASGLPLPAEVHGIIADCGFYSMKQQLRDIASGWFHLHDIESLLFRVDLFCRIFAGFSMKDTKTDMAMERNRRPVLFFHGARDTYVLPENTCRNYELCRAKKEMLIVPKARHLCCSYVDKKLYQRKLMEFFEKYDQ